MNRWRKHKGKFEKVNGPTLDRNFDWINWDAGVPYIHGRLRMTARARKIAGNRLNEVRA